MACLHPKGIPNPLYGRLISKAGTPVIGYQPKYITVPCGRCINCLSLRQDTWAWRIEQEALYTARNKGSVFFITLTYNDENLLWSGDKPTLWKDDVQKFIKRARNRLEFRYFLCGEYGDKFGRPHYHMIIFLKSWISSSSVHDILFDCWKKCDPAELHVDCFSLKTAEYVAKYSCKRFGVDYSGVVPPFGIMSLKPPIGECFLKDLRNTDLLRNQMSITVYDSYGRPHMLPRCFRERVFTPYELKSIYRKLELEQEHIDEILSGHHAGSLEFLRWRDYDYKNKLFDEQYRVREKWYKNFGKDCNLTFSAYFSTI